MLGHFTSLKTSTNFNSNTNFWLHLLHKINNECHGFYGWILSWETVQKDYRPSTEKNRLHIQRFSASHPFVLLPTGRGQPKADLFAQHSTINILIVVLYFCQSATSMVSETDGREIVIRCWHILSPAIEFNGPQT